MDGPLPGDLPGAPFPLLPANLSIPNGFTPRDERLFYLRSDLILALVALLGWQISQTRIFWAALTDLLLYHYLLHPSTLVALPADRLKTFEILVVGLPLYWTILFLIRESKLISEPTLSRIGLAVSPLLLFLALAGWAPDIHHQILHWKFFWGPMAVWPELSALTLLGFGAAVYFTHDHKIQPFLVAFYVARLPLFLSLYLSLALDVQPLLAVNRFLVICSFLSLSAVFLAEIIRLYLKRVYQDPLTAIPNRQALDDRLHGLSGQYAIAMVDIDHFKKFNDTYGHAEGDNVLRMVAQHLMGHLGRDIYRYGGEEFCVVFEGEKREEAETRMELARGTLEKRKFSLRGKRRREDEKAETSLEEAGHRGKVQITISVGIAERKKNNLDYREVIKKADRALYEAKGQGRNRVVQAK